jgi:hypothetical protein
MLGEVDTNYLLYCVRGLTPPSLAGICSGCGDSPQRTMSIGVGPPLSKIPFLQLQPTTLSLTLRQGPRIVSLLIQLGGGKVSLRGRVVGSAMPP